VVHHIGMHLRKETEPASIMWCFNYRTDDEEKSTAESTEEYHTSFLKPYSMGGQLYKL
jgi:hypothetical protein